ncbi:MAG: hypothetical protein OEN50_00420, partial [Deltaproteobacteria bacterium]|nr:hypothetical protein [Deltaproteobacteria bacterium]
MCDEPSGAPLCWGSDSSGQLGDDDALIDQLRPVAVPSFTLNIDPVVELNGKKREATVHIIATCEEGHRLRVKVQSPQGSARGHATNTSSAPALWRNSPSESTRKEEILSCQAGLGR